MDFNCVRDREDFGRKFNRPILSKRLGYSPLFGRWRILVSVGNRSKLHETNAYMLANGFLTTCALVSENFG